MGRLGGLTKNPLDHIDQDRAEDDKGGVAAPSLKLKLGGTIGLRSWGST